MILNISFEYFQPQRVLNQELNKNNREIGQKTFTSFHRRCESLREILSKSLRWPLLSLAPERVMSVDALDTGLPQCIYLVQATLSIYVDKIFLHSSTFGQSCFLPSSLFQDLNVFIHSFHANRPNNSQCKYHATGRKLLRQVLIWNKMVQGKFVLVC